MVNAQADAHGLAVRDGPKTKLTPNRMPEISTGHHQLDGTQVCQRSWFAVLAMTPDESSGTARGEHVTGTIIEAAAWTVKLKRLVGQR